MYVYDGTEMTSVYSSVLFIVLIANRLYQVVLIHFDCKIRELDHSDETWRCPISFKTSHYKRE